jgi:hypothetical protein
MSLCGDVFANTNSMIGEREQEAAGLQVPLPVPRGAFWSSLFQEGPKASREVRCLFHPPVKGE